MMSALAANAGAAPSNPMILAVLIGCELGFWVFLLGGVLARYAWGKQRLGGVLLFCVPLVDVVLIVTSILDLRAGGTPGLMHNLAAAYLGFSIAFGPDIVRRTDARFAQRFGGADAPAPPPSHGRERVRREWRMWGRCVAALAIATVMTLLMYVLAGPGSERARLWDFERPMVVVTVVWFVIGPLWYTLFPPRKREPESENA